MRRRISEEPPPSLVAYEIEPGRVIFVHTMPTTPKVPGLGEAEQEVLALLLRGHDIRAIAAERGTSPRTIANQVANVYRKVGVSSRAELAAKLLRPD